MRITYCPMRYDGTEPCMGAPCALAVKDMKSGAWFCSVAINDTTTSGRFMFNRIAQGDRDAQQSDEPRHAETEVNHVR